MGRGLVILSGILMLALLAGGLTEATWALGHRGSTADDLATRPAPMLTPTPRVSATPSPTATPTPTATPVATTTPIATPLPTATSAAVKTATTNSFVRLRAGKSTSTAILAELNGGTVVTLMPDSDAQWQQVKYNTQVGYIFKTYLAY